ncbi:unnamed protein product [Phaedon cochleariae]|uniref:Uncharacterized protein n=1 Tax=Phaedon cochleariae TaxID=80249 RepID=A0A9P0DQ46_PHACE|nr:unnamed protein product [Phaedon cochleariae]
MALILISVSFLAIAFVSLKLYLTLKCKWCMSKICLVGKTVIITGANSGIGYEAALEIAKRGARVILACRNEDKAVQARDSIIRETGNSNVTFGLIDFSSLESIRQFAKQILANEKRLDILINNAGVGFLRDKMTVDGLQVLMQVNYFGPVLLTMLLLDLLKKSAPSRIINVSSLLAKKANLTVENLNKYPGKIKNYNNSKLGNILFTMKLAELLKNSDVSLFSVHPGVIDTNIFRKIQGFRKIILDFVKTVYFKTPEEGAQTILFTALEPGLEIYTGGHFDECALRETYETAKDPILMESIWKKTMELLNLEVDQLLSSS